MGDAPQIQSNLSDEFMLPNFSLIKQKQQTTVDEVASLSGRAQQTVLFLNETAIKQQFVHKPIGRVPAYPKCRMPSISLQRCNTEIKMLTAISTAKIPLGKNRIYIKFRSWNALWQSAIQANTALLKKDRSKTLLGTHNMGNLPNL